MTWQPTPGTVAEQRHRERQERGRRIAEAHLAHMRALLTGQPTQFPDIQGDRYDDDEAF